MPHSQSQNCTLSRPHTSSRSPRPHPRTPFQDPTSYLRHHTSSQVFISCLKILHSVPKLHPFSRSHPISGPYLGTLSYLGTPHPISDPIPYFEDLHSVSRLHTPSRPHNHISRPHIISHGLPQDPTFLLKTPHHISRHAPKYFKTSLPISRHHI